MNRRQSSGKLLVTALFGLVFVAGALLVVQYQSALRDWVNVIQYQPTQAVASIATDAGLSERGRYIFYTGEPSLENATGFNASCGKHEKTTAVLGCYAGQKIYLYNVDSKELAGIIEVTAAHEMLHAAYDRLSEDDRRRVDTMLETMLSTMQTDREFQERMSVYKRLSKPDQLNELHSIFGTELSRLSSDLETYYQQYFSDRLQTVKLYHKYSSVFSRLESQAKTLADRYNQLVADRNSLVSASNSEYEQLGVDIKAYEASATTDTKTAESLNRRIDDFNKRLPTIRQRIASYDTEIADTKREIEAIKIHTEQLNQSIDSTLSESKQEVKGE